MNTKSAVKKECLNICLNVSGVVQLVPATGSTGKEPESQQNCLWIQFWILLRTIYATVQFWKEPQLCIFASFCGEMGCNNISDTGWSMVIKGFVNVKKRFHITLTVFWISSKIFKKRCPRVRKMDYIPLIMYVQVNDTILKCPLFLCEWNSSVFHKGGGRILLILLLVIYNKCTHEPGTSQEQ